MAREATPVAYDSSLKEAFLAPDQLTYIRPGFNLKIASVTNFAAGKKPVVEIFMTDDLKAAAGPHGPPDARRHLRPVHPGRLGRDEEVLHELPRLRRGPRQEREPEP